MGNAREYHVYILTNPHHTVLYTGVTGDVARRLAEHRQKTVPGFSQRYNTIKLVHVEAYPSIHDATAREKQLKGGSRQRKLDLINAHNPAWRDLADDLF